MSSRLARLQPRTWTPTERLALRFAEFLGTAGVATFAVTLHPIGTFVMGLGWACVLFELDRWERSGG